MSKLRCNGVGGGPSHRPPRGKGGASRPGGRPLPCGAAVGASRLRAHKAPAAMPRPITSGTDPVLLLLSCREAIRAVLLAAEATRAHGAPFSTSERHFLRQVALPVIEQFLSRIQQIRSEQEQQQWERYEALPPHGERPMNSG